MKAKTIINTTGLVAALMLAPDLTTAQIPLQGFASNHEGIAVWNANGMGHEIAAEGHPLSLARFNNMPYYFASRDYQNIDFDPDASMCHFMDDIKGFPKFVRALEDAGFLAKDVKMKLEAMSLDTDIEGEDWLIMGNVHHSNYYNGFYHIVINDEPMISGHMNYIHTSINKTSSIWKSEASFSTPEDVSNSGSPEIKSIAMAFIADMDGQELRLIIENMYWSGEWIQGHGRDGHLLEVESAYLEKGIPELPLIGLGSNHEGIAAWDADGSGSEPKTSGHSFTFGGYNWRMPYYIASRDYSGIDQDSSAALFHFTDNAQGFLNLELQLEYRGFSLDQLKAKTSISTLGNNIEGVDWGLDENNYWCQHYGNTITIEIAGQPILECFIDTNYSFDDLAQLNANWQSYTTYTNFVDISASESRDAQFIATSLLKDLEGRLVKLSTKGNQVPGNFEANAREGGFHQVTGGALTPGKCMNRNFKAWADETIELEENRLAIKDFTVQPNPFRGAVQIVFELPQQTNVRLEIFNSLGAKVTSLVSNVLPEGQQKISWNARGLAEGVYFFRLQASDVVYTKKIIKSN